MLSPEFVEDIHHVSMLISFCAIVINFYPPFEKIKNVRWRNTYCWFIDFTAALACNWRTQIPSLDREFFGFRRRVRHGIRNWRETHQLTKAANND